MQDNNSIGNKYSFNEQSNTTPQDGSHAGLVNTTNDHASSMSVELPSITLPKGGGAISGIEEKFQVNAAKGNASFSIPIPLSPARLSPGVALGYNSSAGNGPFGLGWQLAIASIKRKTEKGLPQYADDTDSDTFILSGTEDLVRVLKKQDNEWKRFQENKIEAGINYIVRSYRPRIEGLFARIERWEDILTGISHWRTVSKNNVHSYYGLSEEARIFDPKDPARVYEWLLCRTYDDKGNITIYQYRKENFAGIPQLLNEQYRLNNCTQSYPKMILYGNKTPWYLNDALPSDQDFMFKVIFDYGEHDSAKDIPGNIADEINPWTCRMDPFSSYRAGFEIRTYRRCSRIMIFHCFDELPLSPYLVKSIELEYSESMDLQGIAQQESGYSFLVLARQNGHIWDQPAGHYQTKFIPEMELQYRQYAWEGTVNTVSADNLTHAPSGLADKKYLWIDLYNEGISGILTERSGAWYYKSNLGNGEFTNGLPVSPKPSWQGLGTKLSIQDVEGNGKKYLVQLDDRTKGFFKFSEDDQWEPMRNFEEMPTVSSTNMRMLDLNSDGKADLLITEENAFQWYESSGEKGFKLPQRIVREIDEEKGPAILFENRDHSIFLADMSGDGLVDIVRIKNGEICYWPNLGYGRFGAKVNMDNAPLFDHPDAFNPAYLRLADVDGSGTTDIIYLGKNEFRVWMNNSGNQWPQSPIIINAFPSIHNFSDVAVLDFLGTGTACIVYSSLISNQPLLYIDLMAGKKPHLLIGYKNNCGKDVSIDYKPSTYFYLKDKKEGKKWITKLPFPVHCISSVRSQDKIRNTVFTCSYSYRHGYYDFPEREFRGFACVEKLDTEDFDHFKVNDAKNVVDEPLHQPPVRVVSWFHTGAFLRNEKILYQCKNEYFQNTSFTEIDLPQAVFTDQAGNPLQLSPGEAQQAMRACKGLTLRSEVYADDDTDKKLLPYSATHVAYEIRLLQPAGENMFASFLVIPVESVTYGYERNIADPNISQAFVLQTDELGNVLKSASVVYPRVARPTGTPDKVWEQQNKLHIGYNEVFYTQDINSDAIWRLRSAFESKAYEISGITQPNGFFITRSDLKDKINTSAEILFDQDFDGTVQKRLLAHHRSYFMNDAFKGPRPLGELSPLGMSYRSYRMAFTKGLVEKYYAGKVTDQMLKDAKYEHSENDLHWWMPSGEYIYSDDPKSNFYTPLGTTDLLGNENFIAFDQYTFLAVSSTDAIGNKTTSENDYRTLSPVLVTDPNGNRAAVESDALGLTVRSALMGKQGGSDGDTLADPTAMIEYDFFNWKNNGKPNYAKTSAREKHGAANPRWQESYVYSDGGGSLIMAKSQVNPGKARHWNDVTKQVEEVDADPRWIGNGRTIVNNKGKVIKQFENYFSTTSGFENEDALVETGMSPIYYYDPLGRNIRTEFPNGTFTKVEFDAWMLKSYDVVDTVKDSIWFAQKGSPDPLAIPEPVDPDQRAAWLNAKYYDTPMVVHTDSLRRPFYSITDYGNGKQTTVYAEKDSSGRFGRAFDQRNRTVSEGYVNMLGQTILGKTAEKGDAWIFNDALGRLVKLWDNNVREFRTTFDALHRPVSTFVKEGPDEKLYGHIVYGDLFSDQEASTRNIKGKAYQLYDQSGVITLKNIDFKGNILEIEQRTTLEYKTVIDWTPLSGILDINQMQAAADPLLDPEVFHSSSQIDALGRPVSVKLPDNSVFLPEYNEGNGLKSLKVQIRGTGLFVPFLTSQDYDARGQRQFAKFGNGTITKYFYDPQTFRLVNLVTKKNENDGDDKTLQNIKYTFDAAGNIIQSRDDAQQTRYFANAVVFPESKFEYDAVYQLIKASGRELAGLPVNDAAQRNSEDIPFINQSPHINDANAVREYIENYEYDILGNIKRLQHLAKDANWVQRYQYEYETDVNNRTNRLKATSARGDADGVFSDGYTYDLHGNTISMPHLDHLVWNFMDQLKEVDLGGGGKAYYVYGIGGNRTRKVIERIGGKKLERIYLGVVEIYRESQGNNAPDFERYTVHVSDNTGRIAQIDTKTIDTNNTDAVNLLNQANIRYQYGNHLGSASLETDAAGDIISYEEYHPFGTTAYHQSKPGKDLSLKRYRFSGKERDEETGFYYFGARYYAPWLARWTSTDPSGFASGFNVYMYCSNNPVMQHDPDGRDDKPVVNRYDRTKSSISKADKTTDSDEARARIDAAFPVGTTVNKKWTVTGGSFWDKGENILRVEPIGDQKNSGAVGGTGTSGGGGGTKSGGSNTGTKGGSGGGGAKNGGSGGTGGTGGSGTGGTNQGGGTGGGTGTGTKGGAGGKGSGGSGTGTGAGKGTGAGTSTGNGSGKGTGTGTGSGTGSGNTDGSGAGGGGLWDSLPTWAKAAVAVVAVVAVVAAIVFTGGLILEAGLVAAEAAEVAALTAETAAVVAETAEATAVVAETAEAATVIAETAEATGTASTLTSTATAVATNPVTQVAATAAGTEAARGGQDIQAIAAAVEGEGPAIAEEGEAIALGVREHLDDFAKLVNGSTWKVWGTGNFRFQFLDMLNNTSNKIYFNLTGPDGKMLDVWRAVSEGASKSFGTFPVTSWELFQIYQNKEVWTRTIFYFQGEVVNNPFL